MLEVSIQIAASIVFIGAAIALVRVLWRAARTVGSGREREQAILQAEVEVTRAQATIAAYQADRAAAMQPRTYSPTYHYAPHYQREALPAPPPTDLPTSTPSVGGHPPTFADLLARGQVGKGNALLLGYSEGNPIYGDWKDLYSTGIGGISGSGKSWTAAYLLSQSTLHGARIAILDPHAGDGESLSHRLSPLASRFLCAAAGDPRQMMDIVAMVGSELQRRQRNRDNRTPWVLVADEFSSLMRGELADPLARLFESIAQEGRKLGIFAMALGQVWQVSRSGGGELRDSLASCYLHRLRPNQARYLTGLTAAHLPQDLLDLPAGTAYLLSTSGELRRITIPRCTDSDIVAVARLLGDGSEDMITLPPRQPDACPPGAAPATDSGLSQSAATISPEAARAASLFLGGSSMSEIVWELHQVRSNQGSRYQQALAQVHELVREGVGRKPTT
jgi:hypothetical protein